MLSLFRFQLVVAVLAAFVLCGYTASLVECSHSKETTSLSEQHASGVEDGCECLCHATYACFEVAPVALTTPAAKISFISQQGEFPPDAVPLGIDYPPQLG